MARRWETDVHQVDAGGTVLLFKGPGNMGSTAQTQRRGGVELLDGDGVLGVDERLKTTSGWA